MKKYILALDQGTTSSRAVIFKKDGTVLDMAQSEFRQIFPKSGYVEHDPMEIFASQYSVMTEVMAKNGIRGEEIEAIGIANQRETTVMWDRETGKPVYNAIVWQCRRTMGICRSIVSSGFDKYIKESTGLKVDAYFSATKIKWILDNVEGAKELMKQGRLMFGTVDTWLIWKLTGGKVFATDYTNASRTMLFNIHTMEWDEKILEYFGIDESILPEVRPSASDFGCVTVDGAEVPIRGVAGDQQSALFGQRCFEKGDAKVTYGTGCFLLMNTGDAPVESKNGLITTVAIDREGQPCYALEGSVFIGGAVVQWLRDGLRMINESKDSEYFASKVEDSGGVYMVPAFTGLGAPYWDMEARGAILGITRGTTFAHIIRAALESVAFQVNDALSAMENDMESRCSFIKIDGGAAKNDLLASFQADISDKRVVRPLLAESTALGCAMLAGLKSGFFGDVKQENADVFMPDMESGVRKEKLRMWHKAVSRAMHWAEE